MAARTDRGRRDSRYGLQFGAATFLLVSGTLVLVLFILPQRYVLSAGFRESGASFPTPSTPFVPVESVPIEALPLPQPPVEILPGPAELFWSEVTPLLEAGRYDEAFPVFERYLEIFPTDDDVRREYAVSLLAADQTEQAVPVLTEVLEGSANPALRLLLARTLRELGRTDEADVHYAYLEERRPDDVGLALERAQALAWAERYEEAAAVLDAALSRMPGSTPLSVELARTYYSLGRLEDASDVLASMDETTLSGAGAITLRNDVMAALAVPEVEPTPPPPPPPPPTPLEQAVTARVAGDFDLARRLFEDALEEDPDNIEIRQAYADFLEYELADFDGAREALLEVHRIGGLDPAVQYRLAQLEVWTERNEAARSRLMALRQYMDVVGAAPEAGTVSRAEVDALLGDLSRWDGDPIEAARRYRLALAEDPENQRATDGIAALEAEVDRVVVEVEAPRVGGTAYSLTDTDDFLRVDVAGEWTEVRDRWVWGGRLGNRWLGGLRLDGATAYVQGLYTELETARWWRWGTIRTGLQFGAERVRSTWDFSVGASLGHRKPGGSSSELRYLHGPAHPLASTLQSVLAGVVQDRLTVTHNRPLGDRWSFTALVDGAWLRTDQDSIAAGQPRGTGRLQGTLAIGRSLSNTFTLGLATQALTYTDPAPVTPTLPAGSRPLFWDPQAVFAVGPYLQLNRDLSDDWRLTGRFGPGVAWVDERRASGIDLVPAISAEAGIRHEGPRFWTALELFYYQGQFDAYRTYGARLSFSARDFSSLGGAR